MKKQFRKYDINGDGVVSRNELIQIYTALYSELTQEQIVNKVDLLIVKVDLDQSGAIDYTEFIKGVIEEHNVFKEQYVDQAFSLIDI